MSSEEQTVVSLDPLELKKTEMIQSDTLTSPGRNWKLREINDLPKVPQQIHEQARTVFESSDGLSCAVLTFQASLKQRWQLHTEHQAKASLECARQQHRLGVKCTATHPQRRSPGLLKVVLFFFPSPKQILNSLVKTVSNQGAATLLCPLPLSTPLFFSLSWVYWRSIVRCPCWVYKVPFWFN